MEEMVDRHFSACIRMRDVRRIRIVYSVHHKENLLRSDRGLK